MTTMATGGFDAKGRRAALAEGGFAAVWVALTTGPFLAGFAVALQAGAFVQGLLVSLPFLASTAQLAGAWAVEVKGLPRRTTAIRGFLVSRFAFVLLAVAGAALLPAYGPAMLMATLILVAVSHLAHHFGHVAWLSLLSNGVPAAGRGGFFGARNLLAGTVSVAFTAAGGLVAGFDFGRPAAEHTGYLILFATAAVLGMSGVSAIRRIPPEPRPPAAARPALSQSVRQCLRDRDYRRFLVFYLCWMGAVYIASPFFNFYFLDAMRLDIGFVALAQTASTFAALTTVRIWGNMVDRFGCKPILTVTLSVATLIPLVYTFTTPANIHAVALGMQALSGAVWSGLSLAGYNFLLKLAPERNNATYLATFGTLSGLASGLAPLAAGAASHAFDGMAWTLAGIEMGRYQLLFLASFVARGAAAMLLMRIPEPAARSAVDVVRALGTWRTLFSITGLDLVYSYVLAPIYRRFGGRPVQEDGAAGTETQRKTTPV